MILCYLPPIGGTRNNPMISGSVSMFNFTTSIRPRIDPPGSGGGIHQTLPWNKNKIRFQNVFHHNLNLTELFFQQKNNWHHGEVLFFWGFLFWSFFCENKSTRKTTMFFGIFFLSLKLETNLNIKSRELESRLINSSFDSRNDCTELHP